MNQRSSLVRIGVVGVVLALVAGCSPSPGTSPQLTDATTPTPASPTPASPATAAPTVGPSATPVPTTATAASASPGEAPSAGWPYTSSAGITDALFGEDGRVVLAEHDGRVTVLDSGGSLVPGWPWTSGGTGDGAPRVAFGPEGSLYVAVRVGTEVDPATFTWTLHRLDPDGRDMAGFPVDLPGPH